MNYNVIISIKETDKGLVFVARYPALEGVSGTGKSQIEALQDLQENAEAHSEFMKIYGEEPPSPDIDIPVNSVRAFQVRLPYDLYSSLIQYSESSKQSMNQLIILALQRHLLHFDYLSEFKQAIKQELR